MKHIAWILIGLLLTIGAGWYLSKPHTTKKYPSCCKPYDIKQDIQNYYRTHHK